MMFCSCKAVDSRMIEERLKLGHSLTEIMEDTGAGSNCGSCISSIVSHIETHTKTAKVKCKSESAI